jgi:hypothetical protein
MDCCVRVIGRPVDELEIQSVGGIELLTVLVVLAMSMFTVDQRQFALVFQLGESSGSSVSRASTSRCR